MLWLQYIAFHTPPYSPPDSSCGGVQQTNQTLHNIGSNEIRHQMDPVNEPNIILKLLGAFNTKQLLQSLKLLSVVNVIDDVSSIDGLSKLREIQRKRIGPLIGLWKTIQSMNKNTINIINLDGNNIKNNNPVINAVSLEIITIYLFIFKQSMISPVVTN